MMKKLIAVLVISLSALPAQDALAATSSDATYDLLDNVIAADSVEFSVDIDFTTDSDRLEHPVAVHVDVDGQSDVDNERAAFDLHFSTTDQYGTFQEASGSVVSTSDKLYIAEDGGEWYFIDQANAHLSHDFTAEDLDKVKTQLQDLFDQGVITYEAEGLDYLNRKLTVRYAYEVDNDKFVDYLVDNGFLSEDQGNEARTAMADKLTVGGKFWVDTSEMLPVMFTLDVDVVPNETSHMNFNVSVFFKSFNAPVDIDIPDNATDIRELDSDEIDTVAFESVGNSFDSMDTDGDGLTNEEETSTWGSNPLSTDSDSDGYPDYTEVVNGYDPNGVGKLDSDKDGLTDYNEMTIHWSDRFDADTDGDGYNDGLEIANGYDPNGPGRW